MPYVQVMNDNTMEHVEYFKGDKIVIPPGGSVKMEEDEAHMFKGQYFPMIKDADGQQQRKSFKMLRIVAVDSVDPEVIKYKCNICKYEGHNDTDLNEHSKATHAGQAIVDEDAEKEIKRKPGRPVGS